MGSEEVGARSESEKCPRPTSMNRTPGAASQAIANMRAEHNEQLKAQKLAATAMTQASFNAAAAAVVSQPRIKRRGPVLFPL